MNQPTFRIDGAAFSTIDGFWDEIQNKLLDGQPGPRNLESFRELLRGEMAGLPPRFGIVWEHSDLSRRRLSDPSRDWFNVLVNMIAEHPNVDLYLS